MLLIGPRRHDTFSTWQHQPLVSWNILTCPQPWKLQLIRLYSSSWCLSLPNRARNPTSETRLWSPFIRLKYRGITPRCTETGREAASEIWGCYCPTGLTAIGRGHLTWHFSTWLLSEWTLFAIKYWGWPLLKPVFKKLWGCLKSKYI